jgi:hypothetical protein
VAVLYVQMRDADQTHAEEVFDRSVAWPCLLEDEWCGDFERR